MRPAAAPAPAAAWRRDAYAHIDRRLGQALAAAPPDAPPLAAPLAAALAAAKAAYERDPAAVAGPPGGP